MKDPLGGNGTVKSKKVLVATGLDRSSMPNLKPPTAAPTVQADVYGGMKNKNAQPARRGPSNNSNPIPTRRQPIEPPSISSTPSSPQAKALYDFEPESGDELAFKTGDIINVHEQEGEWWKGELNGTTGIFPYNYVQLLPQQPRPQPKRTTGPPSNIGPSPVRRAQQPNPSVTRTQPSPTRVNGNMSPRQGGPVSRGPPPNRGGPGPVSRGPPPSRGGPRGGY